MFLVYFIIDINFICVVFKMLDRAGMKDVVAISAGHGFESKESKKSIQQRKKTNYHIPNAKPRIADKTPNVCFFYFENNTLMNPLNQSVFVFIYPETGVSIMSTGRLVFYVRYYT